MFSRPVSAAIRASSTTLKTVLSCPGTAASGSAGVSAALPAQRQATVHLKTSALAAAAPARKRPCGKCLTCSCHTKVGVSATRAASSTAVSSTAVGNNLISTPVKTPVRGQSTAVPQAALRFEPHVEGRPAWIKDPTNPKGKSIDSVHAVNEAGKQWLVVDWANGERSQFPYLWMRDNCTCPECFHPTTLSRRFLMKNLDVNLKAVNVKVEPETRQVLVDWSDGHQSVYPFSWLEGRAFTEQTRQQRTKWLPRQHLYWGEEMQGRMPTDTFENVMNDDKALYRWMNTLEQTGLFLIKDTPTEEGQLELLGERVAFLKPTHFGALWEVRTRENPSNLQYTTATLGLHIDLTYYDYTPGVQLLHCIKQAKAEGGDNQFCDGFHIAERMRVEQPENYKLLTEELIDHYDLGEEANSTKFFKLQRQPVIRKDREGKYDRITYNNMVRDNVLAVDVDKVNKLYRAMKAFDDMLHDKQSQVVYKMEPGDIVCFHNYRVLHGRSGYKPLEAGDRFLQGAFFDWDEVYSRRRCLQMALDIQE